MQIFKKWLGPRDRNANETAPEVYGTLRGSFEFRFNQMVGWVDDPHGPAIGPLRIRIMRYNKLITSLELTRADRKSRYKFVIDATGLFHGRELLNDTIRVVAANAEGETGLIRLDGGSALELIHDHLGLPADPIVDLSFARGGNARNFLGEGWSAAEDEFTWTEGDDSYISIDRPEVEGPLAVRVSTGAFIHHPTVTSQILEVSISGAFLFRTEFTFAHACFFETAFETSILPDANELLIRLHHPDACRPSDVFAKSRDQRRLAFSFRRFALVRREPVGGLSIL